jgi:hypothetical protein
VGNEPAVAAKQHDVSFGDIAAGCLLDYERISGPDCRQHAPAYGTESERSGRMQHLCGQFAFEGVGIVQNW